MEALTFWKAVTMDESDLLERLLAVLYEHEVDYCVVGGQAVNAYVEPLVSLDLDLALAAGEIERLERLLTPPFRVERFPHSLNVSLPGSELRVQVQLDPRYEEFPRHAEDREVLGKRLPVARIEDVLQGKVWAAGDATRRPSKRQKDLADISRILETYPHLRERVPADLLTRLL